MGAAAAKPTDKAYYDTQVEFAQAAMLVMALTVPAAAYCRWYPVAALLVAGMASCYAFGTVGHDWCPPDATDPVCIWYASMLDHASDLMWACIGLLTLNYAWLLVWRLLGPRAPPVAHKPVMMPAFPPAPAPVPASAAAPVQTAPAASNSFNIDRSLVHIHNHTGPGSAQDVSASTGAATAAFLQGLMGWSRPALVGQGPDGGPSH